MTSPYAAGGGGTHLEARVAAACLAAILCEASIRGLPGEFAKTIRTQRAAFDDPLDDIILDGGQNDGRSTELHLQVKNKLSFTQNDDEWIDVLGRAWDTFSKASFDTTLHRIGVGIGTYNARVEQHYQSVFAWAEHSADATHFFERITQGDYSHKDKQSFVATIRAVLDAYCCRALSDDELWRFLKTFVIVHYDFQSADSSRDEANTIDRLKGLLAPEHRSEAGRIWDHLVAKAGEQIPVGGGATRATLVEQLAKDGFTVGPASSYLKDIQSLQRESRRALDDIKSHIHGLKLHRMEAYQKVREALADARFVQIDGEPGSGKSALLKEIAEECARSGPILVLKDSRIHPKGWAAHAHILRVSDDLTALLREFACAGEPILFIDGIDKITDPATQLTVNDILKAIANGPGLADWRILVTIREQNLKHLETWLDPDALKTLSLQTIAVEPLGNEELDLVAKSFPRLGPLLRQSGPDVILKRPFFLNALIGLAGDGEEEQLPATEVELLKLWWQMGGADRKEFASAQHRRNLLIQAAEAIAHAPHAPVAIRTFSPEGLEELKSAGVLRDKEFGHSVIFTHDIYEEWALCELLIGKQAEIAELLQQTGEPDALIRPVQLLGAYALETNPSPDLWKALLDGTGAAFLRPVWQRAVLTSCVQSTRTTQLLQKLTAYLLENGGERLRKLLRAMATIEVLPNPLFLNQQLTPDLEPEERAKYAHLTAVPKPLTWVRFLDWLMPHVAALPASLIPDLLPVFKTWQDTFTVRHVRHCREIGQVSYRWLKEIEEASHPVDWKDYRPAFGGALSGRDAEKSIRALFTENAEDSPEFLTYLTQLRNLENLCRQEKLVAYYLLDTDEEKFALFFERSNSKGIQLNFIDILAAKLYVGFNLRTRVEEFEEANPTLELNREVLVRSISFHVSQGKEIGRTYILSNLSHQHFTEHWDKFTSAYKSVQDFLKTSRLLIHPTWMPYENMNLPLIAVAIQLPHHDFSQISEEQMRLIKTWYWLAIFSRRYSSAAQTYAVEDAQALQKVATGEFGSIVSVINRMQPVIRSKEDLRVVHKKYDAVYKGILNLVSFSTGGYLNFENGNPVSVASNLEDHHIFPNDYLRKNWAEVHESLDSVVSIDCVINRTLIPKLTNVRVSNKPPSKYLAEIQARNPNIAASLKSHLLGEELLTGDYDKNYDYFLEERSDEILRVLRVNVTEVRENILKSSAVA